ncbi:MAG: tyrosine-type recombinase/integrase, partial [Planctomycetales bacterium]
VYHISFRFGGVQFNPSLKTKDRPEAERKKVLVEETISLLNAGRINLPDNLSRQEVLRFILSGGKQAMKPVIKKVADLQTVIDEYFESYIAGKEPSTIAGERIHVNHFVKELGATIPFARITKDVLQQYAAARQKKKGQRGRKISGKTVKKEFRTFSQIWKTAQAKGYVTGKNPCSEVRVDLPDEKPRFRTWGEIEAIIARGGLSEDEQRLLWDCLFLDEQQISELLGHTATNAHPFLHAAFSFAAYTGARRAEIIRSRVEDWDFERDVVVIREKKGSRKQNVTFREVNMHSALKVTMLGWFQNQHPGGGHAIMVPANLPRSKFKSDAPEPLRPDQAHHHFDSAVAGSRWTILKGWHVLRHSFCSNCARRGVPDVVIDAWMGHRGNEEIKKRYRHLYPDDKAKYIQSLFKESPNGEGRGS